MGNSPYLGHPPLICRGFVSRFSLAVLRMPDDRCRISLRILAILACGPKPPVILSDLTVVWGICIRRHRRQRSVGSWYDNPRMTPGIAVLLGDDVSRFCVT